MADESLEFKLSLLDRASAPAKAAEKRLGLLELRLKSLDKLEKEAKTDKARDKIKFQRMELDIQRDLLKAQSAKAKSTEGWITRLHHGLSVARMLGGAMWGVARGVGRAASGFATMAIEAAAAKEQQFLSFRNMLGSGDSARSMLGQLGQLSYKTSFDQSEIIDWGRKLLAGGFGAQDVPSLLRTVSDAAAATGAGADKVDATVDAFRRLRVEGKLTDKTLRTLADVGIDGDAVFSRLGKDLGIAAERAKELAAKGSIGTGSIFDAMMGAVSSTRSGGSLGSAGATAADESVAIMLKKLRDRWGDFFDDLYQGKGFGAFKGFLRNALAALDTTSATGKRLAEALGGAFDTAFGGLFGRLAGPNGLVEIERLTHLVADGIKTAGAAMQGFGSGFGAGLGPALERLGLAFDGPLDADKLDQIEDSFRRLGEEIGKAVGLLADMLGAIKSVVDSWPVRVARGALNDPTVKAAKDGVASVMPFRMPFAPNIFDRISDDYKKMKKEGGEALDFAGRLMDGAGEWFNSDPAAIPALASPALPDGGLTSIGGASMVANVSVQVDARGATPEAAQSIADSTGQSVDRAASASLMRAAMSRGAQ
jgi:tape measure domain-containing protein